MLHRIEGELTARGLSWQDREVGWTQATWTEVSGPGLQVGRILVEPLDRQVLASELVVDAQRWLQQDDGEGPPTTGRPAGEDLGVTVRVEQASVVWETRPLLAGLGGQLYPELDLQGTQGSIKRTGQRVEVTVDVQLDLPHASGQAQVQAILGAENHVTVLVPDLVLDHPLLGTTTPQSSRLNLKWEPGSGALDADGYFGPVNLSVTGTLQPDPLEWDLELRVPGVALEDVVSLFDPDDIPEARGAVLEGQLGLQATLSGPPLTWHLVPEAADLSVDGAIGDPGSLNGGAIAWRVPDSDGDYAVRETGDDSVAWVYARDVPVLVDAIVAAEDSGFHSHRGYDLRAIQEALDQAAAEGASPRGGSTLTQQLAKNLFLNGDRTLVRKLRELLIAVELDRSLRKERLLDLYINVVEFGPELYGARAASERFFLKDPRRLTTVEAVYMASVLPAPTYWYANAYLMERPPRARMAAIIDRMVETEALTPEEAEEAKLAPLSFVPPAPPDEDLEE